jgi:hypothetical protein
MGNVSPGSSLYYGLGHPGVCKCLENPWRRLSYPEASTVAPNAIRTRSFFQKGGQEEEERIPRNQLALFGLRLRGLPERLHGGRD